MMKVTKFWIIVWEVYKKNVRSMAFILMVLSPILIAAAAGGIAYFVSQTATVPEIAIISKNQQVIEALSSSKGEYTLNKKITTEKAAKEALKKEDLAGYLIIEEKNDTITGNYIQSTTSDAVDTTLITQLLTAIQTNQVASKLGLSQKDVAALVTPADVKTTTLKFENGKEETNQATDAMIKRWSAYIVAFAIYMFTLYYSSIIAQEIASEKGTRIMEIILSSVSATQHFFGKLVGILLVCLTQILSYALIGTIVYQIGKSFDFMQEALKGIDLFALLKGLIGNSIVFFIFGIMIYSILAALLGSLVSKVEDVGKAITPLTLLTLVGFFGGMYGFATPNEPLVKIGSYVPFFTPFMMPFRIASDTVNSTGVWASIIIMAVFTMICTYVSLTMYRSNVLIYSDTSLMKSLKCSWVIMRNEKTKQS